MSPNTASIMENTPVNTIIMAVKAVDNDEGSNSYIEYSLAPVTDEKLVIGPVDGLLRVGGPLDREVQSSFSLLVTARDRGYPARSATQTIRVSILDDNDNSPVFDPQHYAATIAENAPISKSVLQVRTDPSCRRGFFCLQYFIPGLTFVVRDAFQRAWKNANTFYGGLWILPTIYFSNLHVSALHTNSWF